MLRLRPHHWQKDHETETLLMKRQGRKPQNQFASRRRHDATDHLFMGARLFSNESLMAKIINDSQLCLSSVSVTQQDCSTRARMLFGSCQGRRRSKST